MVWLLPEPVCLHHLQVSWGRAEETGVEWLSLGSSWEGLIGRGRRKHNSLPLGHFHEAPAVVLGWCWIRNVACIILLNVSLTITLLGAL